MSLISLGRGMSLPGDCDSPAHPICQLLFALPDVLWSSTLGSNARCERPSPREACQSLLVSELGLPPLPIFQQGLAQALWSPTSTALWSHNPQLLWIFTGYPVV